MYDVQLAYANHCLQQADEIASDTFQHVYYNFKVYSDRDRTPMYLTDFELIDHLKAIYKKLQ